MRPAWRLTAGPASLSSDQAGPESGGFSVAVDLGMGCWAGGFTVRLGPNHGLPLAPGAEVGLDLGTDGRLAPVAKGRVLAARPHLAGTEVEVVTDAARLLAIRPVKSYKMAQAGLVIRDLATQAGAAVGLVEPGISLPFYAIDGHQTAFHHVHSLARASGCDAYFDGANRLVVARWLPTGLPLPFQYGNTILQLQATQAEGAPSGTLRAIGEPEASLGKAILVMGTPGGSLDGLYQIRRVRHWLSAETGFITEVDFSGAGGVA